MERGSTLVINGAGDIGYSITQWRDELRVHTESIQQSSRQKQGYRVALIARLAIAIKRYSDSFLCARGKPREIVSNFRPLFAVKPHQ